MDRYSCPTLLALAISIAIGIYYQVPIGADVHYHLNIAEIWVKGNPMITYPSMLHLILVPSVWLGIETSYATALQIILFPLAVYSISRLFKGFSSLLAGLVVMGSYAFVDRAIQVNPQALDFILFPFAIYYSQVNVNNKKFIAVSMLMFFTHSFVALACLGGIFALMLYRRHWKPLCWILLLSSPILIPSILFLHSPLPYLKIGVYENLQEKQFWANPLFFILLYQRLPCVGFILIAYKLFSKKMSNLDSASLLTLFSLSLLIVPWADRFIQYSTIPLSIILTSAMVKLKGKRFEIAQWIVLCFFLMFYITMWLLLLANNYYIA